MDYLRLMRRRPVLVLWLAQSLSMLGDRLYALAVMWVVYASTGSASLMGLVAVAESVPYVVLGTVGRNVVARFSSYATLAWVDGARAIVGGLTAVPVVAAHVRYRGAARRGAAARRARGVVRSEPRRPGARPRRAGEGAAVALYPYSL